MILMLKRACLLSALLACGLLIAAQPGRVRAYLIGTTVGEFTQKCDLRIDLTNDREILFVTHQLTLHVPYDKVNMLEYGQHASHRIIAAIFIHPLLLHSIARKHFVSVGYVDAHGHQQVVFMQVDKNDLRAALAELEAKTGQRTEYTDDEARSGRG
jgi:hypothetical protein